MRRGFSVLELSISLAIAGIVVAAAASSGVVITRILKLDGKKSTADSDSRRLVDFVLSNLQSVGGGPVRPWMAIWHEQGDHDQGDGTEPSGGCLGRNGLPPCGTSDRITLVDIDPNRAPCVIEEVVNDTTVRFARVEDDDEDDGDPPRCCYGWDGEIESTDPDDQFVNQPLMFVAGRNQWALRIATNEVNASDCSYGLEPDTVSHFSNWTTGSPASNAPVPATSFVATFGAGGDNTATPVRPRTLFVETDPETDPPSTRLPRLVEWFDENANATVDDDEVRLVFPGVMNFQLALGFDSNPDNGRVVDSRTSTDEFVGNVANDGAAGLSAVGLRMAQVGVITGVRAVEPGARTLQVLNGPSVTDSKLILRRALGKALLRNVAVSY